MPLLPLLLTRLAREVRPWFRLLGRFMAGVEDFGGWQCVYILLGKKLLEVGVFLCVWLSTIFHFFFFLLFFFML